MRANHDIARRLEALAPTPVRPAAWSRLRRDLAARAAERGLVDVALARHDSPLGPLLLGATAAGLVRLALPCEDPDAVAEELGERVSPRTLRAPSRVVDAARRELDEYFAGARRVFAVPLDWRLARGFRREVLLAAARIPYGRTASYREVAAAAGRPAAARAAGTALATNPIPILVPCHRVVRSGGAPGRYRGGAEAKTALLALERSGEAG